jgi:negative regulator of flagellin synthesis FlgM
VDEIRRQIAAGSYETPEKLELALDRMLDELMGW